MQKRATPRRSKQTVRMLETPDPGLDRRPTSYIALRKPALQFSPTLDRSDATTPHVYAESVGGRVRRLPRERRRHLLGEARHFLPYHRVRLQADIEVENHLVEPRRLDLLQHLRDVSRRAQQHRVFRQ